MDRTSHCLCNGEVYKILMLHFVAKKIFILSDSVEMRPEEVEESVQGHEEKRNESKTMLLVEDNLELRFFLRSIFISNFNVIEAVNGAEGLDKALKFVPDIIISDIMMPEKDGITMTEDLRANMATSHIPVVLLTAKTDMDSKLEGMELGVEDYITKPFSATGEYSDTTCQVATVVLCESDEYSACCGGRTANTA